MKDTVIKLTLMEASSCLGHSASLGKEEKIMKIKIETKIDKEINLITCALGLL